MREKYRDMREKYRDMREKERYMREKERDERASQMREGMEGWVRDIKIEQERQTETD